MKNTYNKIYIFDCQEIDVVYNIIKRKMQLKHDVKTIIKDDTLLVKPNYRYTFFCPIEISTVAFCGQLICKNDKVILYGKYKFNYLPIIFLSIVLLFFL